jgi:hypothetical protein
MAIDLDASRRVEGRSPVTTARPVARARAFFAEHARGSGDLVAEKRDLLRAYDVPAMDEVVAICCWGRSGSLLLASFLDGHDHVITLPLEKSERIYEFYLAHPDLTLRERLLAYPIHVEAYLPFFDDAFAIPAPHYHAAVEALMAAYGDRSPDFLASSRTFFQFVHVAVALALGQRPATPRPTMVYAQHHVRDDLAARLVADFPKARFLHTVRDPISCCDSSFAFYLKLVIGDAKFSRHGYLLAAALGSLTELTESDRANGGMAERTRAVRFEDLHLQPVATMRGVADWLGLADSPSLRISSFNGRPWVFEREGVSWSGARPEQAKRQSPHSWPMDRALVYALFHEDFVAWNYPFPPAFARPWVRRLTQAALWLVPTKQEIVAMGAVWRLQVIPCLRRGEISFAVRPLFRLVSCHIALARRSGAALRLRLAGRHRPLETKDRAPAQDETDGKLAHPG